MTTQQKKPTRRNISLKIVSLMMGSTFWYIFGNMLPTNSWITVPLYFYNIPKDATIKAPETIAIKIVGKRSEIRMLDLNQIAIHINVQKLHEGTNTITCDQERMFLPDTIKLVHYVPSNPIIELRKTKDHQDI